MESVTAENPVARDVIEWVEREYRAGRDDPITNDELEAQVAVLLE